MGGLVETNIQNQPPLSIRNLKGQVLEIGYLTEQKAILYVFENPDYLKTDLFLVCGHVDGPCSDECERFEFHDSFVYFCVTDWIFRSLLLDEGDLAKDEHKYIRDAVFDTFLKELGKLLREYPDRLVRTMSIFIGTSTGLQQYLSQFIDKSTESEE
jgi:hypothetical protein